VRVSPAVSNFNAGELGATLEGRVDLAKYQNGLKRCENFIPLVQGALQRRGGTRFVAEVKDSADRTWTARFEFSATQAFVLEFGDLYVRFYTDHGVVESAPGVPYEIVSPYAAADLITDEGTFALSIEQSGDVLYIASNGDIQPQTLTRFGNTNWVFADYEPTTGPFLDQNKDETQVLWASAATGSITLKSNANLFASTDVGRLVRLQAQNLDVDPWEPDSNAAVNAGDLRRYDGKTYKALNSNKTGTIPPTHSSGVARDGNDTSIGVYWEYQDANYGVVKITAYTSATEVTATVLTQLPAGVVGSAKTITGITQANPGVVTSAAHGIPTATTVYLYGVVGMTEVNNKFFRTGTVGANTFDLAQTNTTSNTAYSSGGTAVVNATTRWSLGAWSETTGYPTAVAFAFERLWWAAGLQLWSSVPGQYDDLSPDTSGSVTADSAITRTLTAQDVNQILWLVEADRLIIGTPGGEFALGPITSVDPLGPDNVQIKRQSKKRCRAVQPLIVGTSVVYVQRSGRRLLRLEYSFEIDRFSSANMNALAPHITRTGIVGMAYQSEPDSVIWCWLADGSLIGFTLDTEQDVIGWHRHPLGGDGFVESVECIPDPNGDRDEVWLIVRRTINGATKRFVEYMERAHEEGDDQENGFYVDAGLTYDGVAVSTVTGLDHLEGETVQVCVDGASHPDCTVSGGEITLNRASSVVHVGLQADARFITLRPEAGGGDGTAQGKVKRIHGATVRLIETLGGKLGMEGSTLSPLLYRRPSASMDQAPPLFSGDIDVTIDGDYEPNGRMEFVNDQPFPTLVVGLFPRMQVNDARK